MRHAGFDPEEVREDICRVRSSRLPPRHLSSRCDGRTQTAWQSCRSNAQGVRCVTLGDPLNMAHLRIEPVLPEITPAQSLTGWHREFCVELLDGQAAAIFVRAVQTGSSKATELRRAILFRRLAPGFADLSGCIEAIRSELEKLVDTSRRLRPDSTNLFRAVDYDRVVWERVQHRIDRWGRR
jgi:hypothetical protein